MKNWFLMVLLYFKNWLIIIVCDFLIFSKSFGYFNKSNSSSISKRSFFWIVEFNFHQINLQNHRNYHVLFDFLFLIIFQFQKNLHFQMLFQSLLNSKQHFHFQKHRFFLNQKTLQIQMDSLQQNIFFKFWWIFIFKCFFELLFFFVFTKIFKK